MGAIKDVVDLATQLSESVQDRKFATDLFKIIQLVNTIQAEQASLAERNIELMTENSQLKQSVASLQSDITKLQDQISNLKSPPPKTGSEMPELTLNILHYASQAQDGVSVFMVQHNFNISNAKATHQIGKLEKLALIDCASFVMGEELKYFPTQEGLDLLNEYDLL